MSRADHRLAPRAHQTSSVRALAWVALLASAGVTAAQVDERGVVLRPADARLFADALLQRIELQVNTRDWDTLRANYLLNTYYPATFLWQGQIVRNVGIRSRGSGTRSGTKPGLLVDFDRYVKDQLFLGLEALVLDNHLQDPSAMREALTMAVQAQVGIPAPREALAEVYVNGDFLGIYTLVENIDSVAVGRMFAPPLGPASGVGATPIRLPLRTPPAAPEVPTGYLFEYNWLDYFYGDYPGPDLELYEELLEAETRDTEPRETLYRPIETMFREINEAPDDSFLDRVSQVLDLRQFVKLAAVQAYMADYDGVVGSFGFNNFYLYRPAAGGPHTIIPWDEDVALHNVAYRVDAEHEKNVLMRRSMRVPALRQLFLDTLEAVAVLTERREGGQSVGWLEREIDRRYRLVRSGMHQDRAKPWSNDEFESGVVANRDFARGRGAAVREQLQGYVHHTRR